MSPILFTIGSFNVYAFGFFLCLAFLFSTFIVWKWAKEELKEEEYLDAFLYTNIAALVSARLVYIIFHINDFGLTILKYILVRETPGLSLLGGLLGGLIFLFWYTRKTKENFWKLLDLFSVAGSFALVLAKIGEQLGGAGFGRETNLFLGVNIVGLPGRHHPVEFYEAILLAILTIILFIIYPKVKRNIYPQGLISYIFGLGLSLIIMLLEFLKVYPVYLYGASIRQIAAAVIFLAIGGAFIKKIKDVKKLKIEL